MRARGKPEGVRLACAPQSLVEDAEGIEMEVNGRKRQRVRDSFFLWFEEGVARGEASIADDPVADIIKEQIWPNPLALYQAASEARARRYFSPCFHR
jgi:hypothetical protein